MSNIHHMKTRSKTKKKKIITKIVSSSSDSSDDEDDIDSQGNIKGLIDYDNDDDVKYHEPDKNRKRKIKMNRNNGIKKSRTREDNMLSDIFLEYILQNANDKLNHDNDLENSGNNSINDSSVNDSSINDSINDSSVNDSDTDTDSSDDNDIKTEIYKMDQYDLEYEYFLDSEKNSENLELDYFTKLDTEKKVYILSQINNIQKHENNDIPLKFKILSSDMDTNTKSIAISQLNKCDTMDTTSGEYNKTKQWINGLIQIPFNKFTSLPVSDNDSISDKKNFLVNTNKILNDAIYGHTSAKNHILQVMSKWIKNPQSGGNILAIQGPMGNGKTTLVKKGIAKAIGRPFHFIALGGASDSSSFDGHHYTYEGSKYGRIVEILIQSKCMNPIFYFDELDKISDTQKGDEIVHLLTHLTDTSQNDKFHDNYFSGIDIDLSKALFIFSFNDEHKIDRILKDRMYVIRTKGFKTEDKLHIANDYLLPELLETYNYCDNIIFHDDIIKNIIENFTDNEQGVRNLKRCLETIISKVNMYELLYDCENDKSSIDLDYSITDFSIPYNVKTEDLEILLKKNDVMDKPPEHMYV
jgi:ATP-dependent Lon protease